MRSSHVEKLVLVMAAGGVAGLVAHGCADEDPRRAALDQMQEIMANPQSYSGSSSSTSVSSSSSTSVSSSSSTSVSSSSSTSAASSSSSGSTSVSTGATGSGGAGGAPASTTTTGSGDLCSNFTLCTSDADCVGNPDGPSCIQCPACGQHCWTQPDSSSSTGSGMDAGADADAGVDPCRQKPRPWPPAPWSPNYPPPAGTTCLPPQLPTPACPGWSATPPQDDGTGNPGCQLWQDYCEAGVTFGCNAYFFCMTAGEGPQANCARACIQSNIPDPGSIGNNEGDPYTKCEYMKDNGLDCMCLFYREAACIDACGARPLLPWGVDPTPTTFPPACGGPLQIQRFLEDLCPDPTIFYGGKSCAQIVDDMEDWAGINLPPCSIKL